ncbi:MAG: exodeoxyribonuclease V subunit beta [Spirochaetes bacterium]|nr:exodeoxyribonuclease V subunit beta [Spirochaetota bacterium]
MNNMKSVNHFSEYSLDGINCIEASAGTGKTYTISHLYLRLMIGKCLNIDNILVVTFTNAATNELRSRIRSLIKIANEMLEDRCDSEVVKKYSELYEYLKNICIDYNDQSCCSKKIIKKKLELALHEIDKAPIYTIHSFCSRTLNEYAFESRSLFGSRLVEDVTPFMQRVVEDFYYTKIAPLGEEFIALFVHNKDDFVSWLMQLLRKLPDDPDIVILPEVAFDPDTVKQLVEQLAQKITTIRTMFEREFGAIADNYHKALAEGVLNKRSYREDDIDKLKEALAMLSVYTALDDEIYSTVKKFSLTRLLSMMNRESNKGNKTYQWHTFFTLLDECSKTIVAIKVQIIAAYRDFILTHPNLYSQYRDRYNIISFRDILKDMYNALQDGVDSKLAIMVRKRFKAALIDEFQDTDPLQYTIFTTIFNKPDYTLYIIGDPKQAIYSFRGADVFAYIKARKNAKEKYTLDKSYRSTPALTKAINYIFGRLNNPFVFDEIAYNPVESKIQNSCFDNGALQIWFLKSVPGVSDNIPIGIARKIIAKNIALEIQKLMGPSYTIDGRRLQYSDIAILVRKHHEAQLVQDVLRQYNIHSVVYSRQSVFSSSEVWELLHILEAIIHPSSTADVKRALVTSFFGYSAEDIIKLEQQGSLDTIKMQCAAYQKTWELKGFIVMLQHLLHDDTIVKKESDNDTVSQRLLRFPDGERVMTNILHCAEILTDIERQKKLDPIALVEWFKKAIYYKANIEEQELRLESDANAVKIVTVHASKGLEYPVVFCPYLFDSSGLDDVFVFHDNNYINDINDINDTEEDVKTCVCFKFKKDQVEEKAAIFGNEVYDKLELRAKYEQLAESLRIAYVAITRAKYRCYIGWGNINATRTSALQYLFHFNDNQATISKFIEGTTHKHVDLYSDLDKFKYKLNGTIKIKEIEDQPVRPLDTMQQIYSQPISARHIEKTIAPGWQLTSYTALSYKRDDERSDEIQLPVIDQKQSQGNSIFTFPAGSIPGLCIHKIFETVDFTDSNSIPDVVARVLPVYGIDMQWADVITTMVKNVITVPLHESFIPLSHVPTNKRRNEIEFYYPIENLTSKKLIEVFNEHSLFTQQYGQALQQLWFADISGFMHGYIDMVFEHDGAYYIVDWKSNLLGTSIDDYHRSKLHNTIASHLYFLQYTIYAVALHRYLELMLGKSYNYQKQFGGIFYIFVRGVDSVKGCEYGIFYDKPDIHIIEKINDILNRAKV